MSHAGESIELARKLVLTGFAALWMPGTLMQVITSMFIGLVNIVFISSCKPYCGHALDDGDEADQKKNAIVTNSFALQSVVMTFLSLFGALLSKFNSGFVSTGAVEQGYSYATLQWFLIGTAAFVGLFGLSIVTKEAGACGAFDLLHQSAEKYLPTPVVALIKWLFACRALGHHSIECIEVEPGDETARAAARQVEAKAWKVQTPNQVMGVGPHPKIVV
jgi:hypothetical protein